MTVTLEEALSNLSELIHRLGPGEELVITENNQPLAKLVAARPETAQRKVPRLGTLAGTVLSMERFDEPLEEFAEYL